MLVFFLIRGFLNARVFIIIISLFCLKMNEKKYMDLGGKNSSEMLKLRKAISICMRDAVTLCCLIFFVVVFFSISINDLFSFCLVGPSGPSW